MSGAVSPSYRYGFGGLIAILMLLHSCSETQTQQCSINSPPAILQAPHGKSIDEGNRNVTFTCETCAGELEWIVTKSGKRVNWTEHGITSVVDTTNRSTQRSVLSILASRRNNGLFVRCSIARSPDIQSENVPLRVIFSESEVKVNATDSPATVTVANNTVTENTITESDDDGRKSTNFVWIVVGFIVGLVFLVIGSVLCITYICHHKKPTNDEEQPHVIIDTKPKVNQEANDTTSAVADFVTVNGRSQRCQQISRDLDSSVLPQVSNATSVSVPERVKYFESQSVAKPSVNTQTGSLSTTQESGPVADNMKVYFAVALEGVICRPSMSTVGVRTVLPDSHEKIVNNTDDSTMS